ncbi:helicase-like transcription factor CHR27 isoform X2 [Macadamia integrifolia]|uniref:helicase-like transcription factor CHR27 isoform X2 n=1 Tax=Macadamia integrifolia TaxID=60698 RepID=UPI001C4F19A7|nr:helicase-like transcription factor CHR27 isoform X2 [Macadamia integrifolia]XP_042518713.1 helicase-like transcription factor CHR27 isoform X2 [Macadamia integrifolia]
MVISLVKAVSNLSRRNSVWSVDPLRSIFDSSRRCFSLLKRWIEKLHCHGGYCSTMMDPIDITSSDSENEVTIEKKTSLAVGPSASQTSRKLPSWASTSSPNSANCNGSHQTPLLPGRTSLSNKRSANHDHYSQSELQINPNGDKDKTLNQESALIDYSKYSRENGYTDQPMNFVDIENLGRSIDSRNNEMLGTASGKVLSQQNSGRILPPSLHPFSTSTKSKTSLENGARSYIPDTYGKSYNFGGATATDHNFYMKDHLVKGNDNDAIVCENKGSRLLPPSLTQAKSTGFSFGGSNDPVFRPHVGEERSAENDERIIFQAALQVIFS